MKEKVVSSNRLPVARTLVSCAVLGVLLTGCGMGTQTAAPTELSARGGLVSTSENTSFQIDLNNYTSGPAYRSYSVSSRPQHGILSLHGSIIDYVPDSDFSGHDAFEFTVTDAFGQALTSVIEIDVTQKTVTKKARLAVIIPDELSTSPGTVLPIAPVLLNDDGTAKHKLLVPSSFGTVVIQNDKIHYTPLSNFIGLDRFEIETTNNSGDHIVNIIEVRVSGSLATPATTDQQDIEIPAHRQLFTLSAGQHDEAASLEWMQLSGPIANIFQDNSGRALIQTAASFEEVEVGLYADNILIESFSITPKARSDKHNPFHLSLFPFDPLHVITTDRHAYVFLADLGLVSIDITDSRHPKIIGVYHSYRYAEAMAIQENRLVFGGYNFLEALNIEDPQQPVLEKSIYIPHLDLSELTLDGDTVTAYTRYRGILDISLSDTHISTKENSNGYYDGVLKGSEKHYLFIHDNALVVSTSDSPLPLKTLDVNRLETAIVEGDKLYIIDRGTFSIHDLYSEETLFTHNLNTSYNASGLSFHDDYILIENQEYGAFVFQSAPGSEVTYIGNFNTADTLVNADISNGQLAMIDDKTGLQLIALDTVEDIHWASTNNFAGNYHDTLKAGDYLYIANQGQGLITLDITDPLFTDWSATSTFPISNYRIQRQNNTLFTSGLTNGVSLYDISLSPDNPEYLETYDAKDAKGVASDGNRLVIANGSHGVLFYNTDSTNAPVSLTGERIGEARAVVIHNDLALVANVSDGLAIFDISNIDQPAHIKSVELPNWAYDIKVAGDIAYVALGAGGVAILDLANPLLPEVISHIDALSSVAIVDSIQLFNDELYIPAGSSGVFIYDISNPETPVVSGHYNTPDRSRSLDVAGDFIYSLSFRSGLNILDNARPQLDVDYLQQPAGSMLQYQVSWDSLDDLSIDCKVSSGSCYIVSVDQPTQTAQLEWETGITPGNNTIQISVGNSRFYRATSDKVTLQ